MTEQDAITEMSELELMESALDEMIALIDKTKQRGNLEEIHFPEPVGDLEKEENG